MRPTSEDNRARLKAATRRAIRAAGGGDSFQHVTRVAEAQLSKYGLASEDHAETFIPVDVALDADLEAGSPIITTAMAQAQGFRLVRAEREDAEHRLEFCDISALGMSFSDLQRALHEALADDGSVDESERRIIQRCGDRLARALLEIMTRA
ncbi:hypothetical protein [Martelella soudanensis]|uniref:hypothetical protein n=1 Tax=unclassified Martelella TaxID=2629616 RepID=UPI0015DFDDAF|nr:MULTISPECIES: hypothetical protein [unclassified Martelella]